MPLILWCTVLISDIRLGNIAIVRMTGLLLILSTPCNASGQENERIRIEYATYLPVYVTSKGEQ